MKHLSEQRLLELLDGETPDEGHLKQCPACRERFDTLRQLMGLLREDPVPEPSPLFWQHLSDRVRLAIEHQSAENSNNATKFVSWWTWRWRWAVAGAVAVMAAAVIMTSQRGRTLDHLAEGVRSVPVLEVNAGVEDLSWSAPADDSWAMVMGLAEGLDFESAAEAGLVVRPGSIDQALLSLSDEERHELAGIIRAELDRSPL
jgi:hypothetical protein